MNLPSPTPSPLNPAIASPVLDSSHNLPGRNLQPGAAERLFSELQAAGLKPERVYDRTGRVTAHSLHEAMHTGARDVLNRLPAFPALGKEVATEAIRNLKPITGLKKLLAEPLAGKENIFRLNTAVSVCQALVSYMHETFPAGATQADLFRLIERFDTDKDGTLTSRDLKRWLASAEAAHNFSLREAVKGTAALLDSAGIHEERTFKASELGELLAQI